MCPCGKRQTMSHIVNSCPQSKMEGAVTIALSWWRCYRMAEDIRLLKALDNNDILQERVNCVIKLCIIDTHITASVCITTDAHTLSHYKILVVTRWSHNCWADFLALRKESTVSLQQQGSYQCRDYKPGWCCSSIDFVVVAVQQCIRNLRWYSACLYPGQRRNVQMWAQVTNYPTSLLAAVWSCGEFHVPWQHTVLCQIWPARH